MNGPTFTWIMSKGEVARYELAKRWFKWLIETHGTTNTTESTKFKSNMQPMTAICRVPF